VWHVTPVRAGLPRFCNLISKNAFDVPSVRKGGAYKKAIKEEIKGAIP
jgi:hypothetical protein